MKTESKDNKKVIIVMVTVLLNAINAIIQFIGYLLRHLCDTKMYGAKQM